MEVVYYRIAAGDTLGAIVRRTYGRNDASMVDFVVSMNSHIANRDRIFAGDTIAMPDPAAHLMPSRPSPLVASQLGQIGGELSRATDEQAGVFLAFSKGLLDSGASVYDIISSRASKAAPALKQMVDNYEKYKAASFSKGVYDYQRMLSLKDHTRKLGVLSDLLYDGKAPNEVLRIDLRKGALRTGRITEALSKAKTLSRIAKGSNVVLAGLGLHITCEEIKAAPTNVEKNRIFVEQAGSMAGSAGAVALGLFLFGTPVGWAGLVLMGIAGTAAGLASGKVTSKLYDSYGDEVDVVSGLGVSKVCSK